MYAGPPQLSGLATRLRASRSSLTAPFSSPSHTLSACWFNNSQLSCGYRYVDQRRSYAFNRQLDSGASRSSRPPAQASGVGKKKGRNYLPTPRQLAKTGPRTRPSIKPDDRRPPRTRPRSEGTSRKRVEEEEESGLVSIEKAAEQRSSSHSSQSSLLKPLPFPVSFNDSPLLPGQLVSIQKLLGSNAKPTVIQKLVIDYLLPRILQQDPEYIKLADPEGKKSPGSWQHFLLASETGSGKTLAYMIPLIQALKRSEPSLSSPREDTEDTPLPRPRSVILAPTHELSRQLNSVAKAMIHDVKLRVFCASTTTGKIENLASRIAGGNIRTNKMREMKSIGQGESERGGEIFIGPGSKGYGVSAQLRDPDILIGTPMTLLDLIKGRRWEAGCSAAPVDLKERKDKGKDGRSSIARDIDIGRALALPNKSQLDLQGVEWIVIDEGDVLFDPDFRQSTLLLLYQIAAARLPQEVSETTTPMPFPFNIIITSATIPQSLNDFLASFSTKTPKLGSIHPPPADGRIRPMPSYHFDNLTKLISPHTHYLPSSITTQFIPWSSKAKGGGGPSGERERWKDVERTIRGIWGEEAEAKNANQPDTDPSKLLIFLNNSKEAESLGEYLRQRSVVPGDVGADGGVLVVTSESRVNKVANTTSKTVNNKYLEGFLNSASSTKQPVTSFGSLDPPPPTPEGKDSGRPPKILLTTSLLSRGLDFNNTSDAGVKNVLIITPKPSKRGDNRNNQSRDSRGNTKGRWEREFLHRAGRVGRLDPNISGGNGNGRAKGRVFVFGHSKDKRMWEDILKRFKKGSKKVPKA